MLTDYIPYLYITCTSPPQFFALATSNKAQWSQCLLMFINMWSRARGHLSILEGWLKTEPSFHSQYSLTSWWNSPRRIQTWPNHAEHRKIRTNRMVFTSRVRRIMRKTLRPGETMTSLCHNIQSYPKRPAMSKDNLCLCGSKSWLLRCCICEPQTQIF